MSGSRKLRQSTRYGDVSKRQRTEQPKSLGSTLESLSPCPCLPAAQGHLVPSFGLAAVPKETGLVLFCLQSLGWSRAFLGAYRVEGTNEGTVSEERQKAQIKQKSHAFVSLPYALYLI